MEQDKIVAKVSSADFNSTGTFLNMYIGLYDVTRQKELHCSRSNLRTIVKLLEKDIEVYEIEKIKLLDIDYKKFGGVILTTSDFMYGGAAIMCLGLLKTTMDYYKWEKIFIFPSSIHEIWLTEFIDDDKGKELLELLKKSNKELMDNHDEENFMSDTLYTFDGKTIEVYQQKGDKSDG